MHHHRYEIVRRAALAASMAAALCSCVLLAPSGHAAVPPEPCTSESCSGVIGRAKLATLLVELSLGPESLCVCQVPPASIPAFIDSARSQLEARADDIAAAESRIFLARAGVAMLENRRQPASSAEEIATAAAELDSARSAYASLQAELFQLVIQGLPTEQRSALTRVRSNRQWGVPVQYLVTDRLPAEWVRLRDALAAAKDATAHQRPVDAAAQATIASAESDPATAGAMQALQAHRTQCRGAWSQAVGS
jgi:hypothetical protein